ncbi:MAG: NYN domain-containing protein [Acidobacteriota bacterium]|nr:NYN domain-containing protein [Acidobacteriota bacterium]
MPLIVDGNNLLGERRDDGARRLLVAEIARLAARERRRIVVVFDGPPPPHRFASVNTHFSGPGKSADTWILDFLREQTRPREWTVVTDDRQLGDRCRHLGARVERRRAFRERLATDRKAEKPTGPVDVEDWEDYFGTRS